MTLAFFNNLRLKHGGFFQFENNQFYLVAIRPNSWKTLKVLAVIVYLHSQTQRFFVDVSFKFSNDRCRYTAYDNFAILLFLMQCVMDYLLALQDFDFRRVFGHRRSITSKSKEVAHTIITLLDVKRFIFYHVFPFPFETGYRFKTFFLS